MDSLAIACEGLCKRFGSKPALDHVDLSVPQGTVHGLLGPNGAGKTTAVRVLATLLRPDSGQAQVAGFDVVRQAPGTCPYRAGRAECGRRRDPVRPPEPGHVRAACATCPQVPRGAGQTNCSSQFGLAEADDKPAGQYSGGMRRRLDLAASFIVAPRVLFLDEPTTGLDPRGRNEVWQVIRALAASGTTVLLTTQYLEEADRLADAIIVIAAGGSSPTAPRTS